MFSQELIIKSNLLVENFDDHVPISGDKEERLLEEQGVFTSLNQSVCSKGI